MTLMQDMPVATDAEEPLFVRGLTLIPAYMPMDETAGLDEYADAHLGAGADALVEEEVNSWPHLLIRDARNEVSVTIGEMAPSEAVDFARRVACEARRFADAVLKAASAAEGVLHEPGIGA